MHGSCPRTLIECWFALSIQLIANRTHSHPPSSADKEAVSGIDFEVFPFGSAWHCVFSTYGTIGLELSLPWPSVTLPKTWALANCSNYLRNSLRSILLEDQHSVHVSGERPFLASSASLSVFISLTLRLSAFSWHRLYPIYRPFSHLLSLCLPSHCLPFSLFFSIFPSGFF